MSQVTPETLQRAYKPYDVVTDKSGNVGFIAEVSVNECQDGFDDQISYHVEWLVGFGDKNAWFKHEELTMHCNLFVRIAEQSCHPFGNNKRHVEKLMKS